MKCLGNNYAAVSALLGGFSPDFLCSIWIYTVCLPYAFSVLLPEKHAKPQTAQLVCNRLPLIVLDPTSVDFSFRKRMCG